jgi:large subunit ribosomal protein L30
MTAKKKLKVTLVQSVIKVLPKHKECVKGLGLRRLNHSVIVADHPSIRGMINKVNYLLSVEEV